MHVEYHRLFSPHLNEDFELKSYGDNGHPIIVFPSQGGRFFDFENWGMIDALRPHIDSGRFKVFAVDGRDWESWSDATKHTHDRAKRHADYDAAILFDVLPFIRARCHQEHPRDLILTGCSMGAYHAVNFFLRHPDVADTVIGLSGVYQLNTFIGPYLDEAVYLQ